MFMCTDKDYIYKNKPYGPFILTGLIFIQVLCHYWAAD